MLIIIEIMLTISVWKSGWKGWALLPIGIVCGFGFVLGMTVGTGGMTRSDLVFPCLMLDFGAIIALIVMRVRAPKKVQEEKSVEPSVESLVTEG